MERAIDRLLQFIEYLKKTMVRLKMPKYLKRSVVYPIAISLIPRKATEVLEVIRLQRFYHHFRS